MSLESRLVVVSRKVYERLLSVYPRSHRREYGQPMVQLFRDQARDAWAEAQVWGLGALWLRVIPDLVRTSFLEHIAALKGKKSMTEKLAGITGSGPAPGKTFLGVAVVIFLLVFGVTALITFQMPEAFASTARIKVGPSNSGLAGNNGPAGEAASMGYDPYYIQTQLEVIRSEPVLGKVIELLKLNSEWGKRYAGGNILKTSESLELLRSRLELRPVRNTSLVEVRTYDESATEAARIANAVANAFREYRLEQQRQLQTDSLKVLTKQLQAQEDKVRDAQSELDRLRKELGLSDMDASGTAPAAMVDADTLRRFETMRIEGEVQLAGQQAQLDQFLGMTNQKLREVLPSVVPDAALHELLSQLNVTELALARLRADTGPNHPETVKTAGQVKLLNQKLDDRITGIMTGLTNQMAVARVKLEKLHESVAEARAKESDRSRGSRAYYDKKQEVEELIRFSSILSMKLATERVDAQLPKSALAEIVDRASPGLKPVRPNKPLNLAIGAAGGCFMALLVGCAAALIVSLKRKGPAGPTTAVA